MIEGRGEGDETANGEGGRSGWLPITPLTSPSCTPASRTHYPDTPEHDGAAGGGARALRGPTELLMGCGRQPYAELRAAVTVALPEVRPLTAMR